MSGQISLKETEKRAFRIKFNDGLGDIFLGCIFLMMVIAPFLSTSLGDFWSSAIFLPFWGILYLAIWLTRKHVVLPRIGTATFRPARVRKLTTFTIIMLIVNVFALILGIFAAVNVGIIPGQIMGVFLGIILLLGFSLAAIFLDAPRYYLYGLLAGIGPVIGEWLWMRGLVSHHGFPITFGVISGVMILTGLVLFFRLILANPLPRENTTQEKG